MDSWNYQYLENEDIHYLTKCDPEDGITDELFFSTYGELKEFVDTNHIPVFLPKDMLIRKSIDREFEHNLIEFEALVRLVEISAEPIKFKSRYTLTYETINNATEKQLGSLIKQMLDQLKIEVRKQQNGKK